MLRKVASTAVVVGGMVFSSAVCLLLPVLARSVVEKNTIEGPGDAALTTAAVPAADLPGNNNQFIDNKLVNFVASQADIVLRTDNNMVVGKFEKVIDTGIRNVFPGKDKD
jgi:hypothetical protein